MDLNLAIGKNNLSITYDLEQIITDLEGLKDEFEDNHYVSLGYREFDDTKRKYITREKYLKNIAIIVDKVEELKKEDMSQYINSFTKKKNGTFNKNKKIKIIDCHNSEFNGEYCGRWDYQALEVRTSSDTHLSLGLYRTSQQENGY